ncbi:MAG: hypothetical protein WC893_02310 [Candidatus Paceibacterota bacterium]|jgi:hypothetical protein
MVKTMSQIKTLGEQVRILKSYFPWLETVEKRETNHPLPLDADGWFAIPRWQSFGASYSEAVERILESLARAQKFQKKCQLTGLRPRQLEQIGNHDILVIPDTFGPKSQLGIFEVGVKLLTHPGRLSHFADPWIECWGDRVGRNIPVFYHRDILKLRLKLEET